MKGPGEPQDRSALARAMSNRGRVNVRPLGLKTALWDDLYYRLMRLSWAQLFFTFASVFVGFNLIFAVLFRLDPTGLAVPHDASQVSLFWRDFFFSVHTVATIGYGNVYPVSAYANVLVVVEITLGIVFFALTTGLVFARFARPFARILFSDRVVIRRVDGVPLLMLRAANQRHNLVYSANVQVALIEDGDVGGTRMRRYRDLSLVRANNPVFALTWTVMHRIDADSPLAAWVDDPSAVGNSELVVVLSGWDVDSGQMIHGRWAYGARDIHWNARFADIITVEGDGGRTIDYARFHEVVSD
jgi:inward rectifier potassium channel